MEFGLELIAAIEELSRNTRQAGRPSDLIQYAGVSCGPSTLTLEPWMGSQSVIRRFQVSKVLKLVALLISRNGAAGMMASIATGGKFETRFDLRLDPSEATARLMI